MIPYHKVGDSIDLSSTNSCTFNGTAPYANMNFQYVWSSVVGAASSFKLQVSNDGGTNWDDVSGVTGSTSGGSGSSGWQISGYSAAAYRVLVTSASTSGALVVTASGNGG